MLAVREVTLNRGGLRALMMQIYARQGWIADEREQWKKVDDCWLPGRSMVVYRLENPAGLDAKLDAFAAAHPADAASGRLLAPECTLAAYGLADDVDIAWGSAPAAEHFWHRGLAFPSLAQAAKALPGAAISPALLHGYSPAPADAATRTRNAARMARRRALAAGLGAVGLLPLALKVRRLFHKPQ